LKDALPVEEDKLLVRFQTPAPEKGLLLSRIHPFVESLASYVLDTSLDPLGQSVAAAARHADRSGLDSHNTLASAPSHASDRDSERSGISATGRDANLLAFEGAPSQAPLAGAGSSGESLARSAHGNIAPEQIRDFSSTSSTECLI